MYICCIGRRWLLAAEIPSADKLERHSSTLVEMRLVDLKSLATRLNQNGQLLESESLIKNEVIQQKPVREVIENEIECPRCYDMMTLCSDFENLYYSVWWLWFPTVYNQKVNVNKNYPWSTSQVTVTTINSYSWQDKILGDI